MSITSRIFGQNSEGQDVTLYTMQNAIGASVSVMDFGGTLQSIIVPDHMGNMSDVCLGFDSMDNYLVKNGSLGAFIGRFGNRIDGGKFTMDGVSYQLNVNAEPNHLHGGNVGYQIRMMQAETVEDDGVDRVIMKLHSPAGEENYPGSLDVTVIYSFDDDCNLGIEYRATTDSKTILNLTNHCYFNLGGHDSGTVDDQLIMIDSDCITKVNQNMIPTGEYYPVSDTPLDLRDFTRIGDGLARQQDCMQMVLGTGYDHNYVLTKGSAMGLCAVVEDEESGRVMEVITDQPGVQFYSGNHLNITGKGGAEYKAHCGLCLETQHYPDAPNHPHFPSTELKKGELYHSATIYAFRVDE